MHDEQLNRQEEYWRLKKIYEAAVIFGLSTDSHDSLGLPGILTRTPSESAIADAVRAMVGRIDLPVPTFSSYRVGGKPLFELTRQGAAVKPPLRRMAISEIALEGLEIATLGWLSREAVRRCSLVKGDFRQPDIIAGWKVHDGSEIELPLARLTIHCDSGTYIRSIAHELGRRLGGGGMLWELRRTAVGPYTLKDTAVTRLSWS